MKCMDGWHPRGFHYHSLAQPTFGLKQTLQSSQNLLVRPKCVCLSRESGLHLLKGSLVNDRREGSCLCYPRLWSFAKTLTGFVTMLNTLVCVQGLPLKLPPLRFKSRAIAVHPCWPSTTKENICRTQSISFRGPRTRIIRSVVRLLCSPSFNFRFRFPSAETIILRSP